MKRRRGWLGNPEIGEPEKGRKVQNFHNKFNDEIALITQPAKIIIIVIE